MDHSALGWSRAASSGLWAILRSIHMFNARIISRHSCGRTLVRFSLAGAAEVFDRFAIRRRQEPGISDYFGNFAPGGLCMGS